MNVTLVRRQQGSASAEFVSVRAHGAVGDGVTDDQAAIQAALDAAGAAGGGVVWFPPGRYLLTAQEVTNLAHLHNPYSHVHMVGAPGATLVSTSAVAMILQGKATNNSDEFEDETVYLFSGSVARGASTVTTATAAHAGNFAAGDWVLLRTGQLTAGAIRHPDAEINQVVSAVAGTGVITLKWPTCKSYAQEYFISGTDGFTSTSVTANLAQFGIANIDALMTEDQQYRGLRFEHTGSNVLSRAIIGGYTCYTIIEGNTGSLPNGFESRGAHRFSVIRDNVFDHPGSNPSESYTLTDDAMCGDTIYSGNILTGQHIPQFHVQEGATGIVIRDNIIRAPGTGSDHNAISIRTRARDVVVSGNILDTYAPALIYVDATSVGGVISDNQVLGSTGTGIAVAGTGYKVTGNRVPNGAKVSLGTYIGGDSDRRVMSCWVYHDSTSVVLGPFPGHIVVYDIKIWVQQAFNPAGTGTISIGSPEADVAAFATATDVKTTGLKTPTLGAYTAYSPLVHTLTAYYAQTSTAATVGKALVVVEYAHVGEGVGFS